MKKQGIYMHLSDLPIAAKAKILKIKKGNPHYRKRLIALGLIPGVEVTLTHVAPLGDPFEIKIKECSITLRKAEAAIIEWAEVS